MAFTVTLNASALIQDVAPATPVTVATDSKTDQETAQDEYLELSITVPAAAVDQNVSMASLDARALYITTTNPVTMKQGVSTFAQPIRSMFMATYGTGQGPTDLKFSNAGASAAQVKIIVGSKNP